MQYVSKPDYKSDSAEGWWIHKQQVIDSAILLSDGGWKSTSFINPNKLCSIAKIWHKKTISAKQKPRAPAEIAVAKTKHWHKHSRLW
jgi:hypothetical protein